MIVLNDEDWATIQAELTAQTAGYQQNNTAGGKQKSTKGLSEIKYAFSTNYLENVYDDPYCPKGTAYILDMDVVSFVSLSNAQHVDDGVAGNNPGAPDIDVDGEPGTNYELLLEDYVDIRPASDTDDGPGQRVSMSVYGNFVLSNTAHAAVVKF